MAVIMIDTPPAGVTRRRTLSECEDVIRAGLASYVDVGFALAEIRDADLYLKTHPTWAAYSRDRLGWSAQRSDQLIRAARLASRLTTIVVKETHARELLVLEHDPAGLAAVVDDVERLAERRGSAATAADYRAAVARYRHRTAAEPRERGKVARLEARIEALEQERAARLRPSRGGRRRVAEDARAEPIGFDREAMLKGQSLRMAGRRAPDRAARDELYRRLSEYPSPFGLREIVADLQAGAIEIDAREAKRLQARLEASRLGLEYLISSLEVKRRRLRTQTEPDGSRRDDERPFASRPPVESEG